LSKKSGEEKRGGEEEKRREKVRTEGREEKVAAVLFWIKKRAGVWLKW
jgi:hypothetical protein